MRADGMPVGVAAFGHGVAEDVVRVLSHAQVGENEGVAVHLRADKTVGEPLQTCGRGSIGRLRESGVVRRMKGEFDRAIVGHHRVDAFVVPALGSRDDAPQEGVKRCGGNEKARLACSVWCEGLARVGCDDGFSRP